MPDYTQLLADKARRVAAERMQMMQSQGGSMFPEGATYKGTENQFSDIPGLGDAVQSLEAPDDPLGDLGNVASALKPFLGPGSVDAAGSMLSKIPSIIAPRGIPDFGMTGTPPPDFPRPQHGQDLMDYQGPGPDEGMENAHLGYTTGGIPTLEQMNPELLAQRKLMEAKRAWGDVEPNSPTANQYEIGEIMDRSQARMKSLFDPRLGRPELDSSYELGDEQGLRAAGQSAMMADDATPEYMKRARRIAAANAGAKSQFAKPQTPGEMSDDELNRSVAEYQGGAKVIDGSQIPKGYGKSASYGGIAMEKDSNGLDYAQRRKAEVAQRHDDATAYRRGMMTDSELDALPEEMRPLGSVPGALTVPGRMDSVGRSIGDIRKAQIQRLMAEAQMKAAEAEMLKAQVESKDQQVAEESQRNGGKLPPAPMTGVGGSGNAPIPQRPTETHKPRIFPADPNKPGTEVVTDASGKRWYKVVVNGIETYEPL